MAPPQYGVHRDVANARVALNYAGTRRFHVNASGAAINGTFTTSGAQTITSGGLTVTSGGVTVTAGGVAITAGGLLVTAGRIREVMTATDVDAQNNTFTVAQIVGGIVVHTSVTGGGTVTTDTAANIIAGSGGNGALTADGQTIMCWYINDGTQVCTFAGGTGVTIADAGQTLAADESALVLFRRDSGTTVTMYHVGG